MDLSIDKLLNWGNLNSLRTNYLSNFSAGVDGWPGNNLTVSGNNDAISDGTTSLDDVLKSYATVTNSTHEISKAIAVVGVPNIITFKYYIPTGQTNVNGLVVYGNVFATNVIDLRSGLGVVGTWTQVSGSYTPSSTTVYIRAFKTFTSSYAGAGSASDDIFYIKDLRVQY